MTRSPAGLPSKPPVTVRSPGQLRPIACSGSPSTASQAACCSAAHSLGPPKSGMPRSSAGPPVTLPVDVGAAVLSSPLDVLASPVADPPVVDAAVVDVVASDVAPVTPVALVPEPPPSSPHADASTETATRPGQDKDRSMPQAITPPPAAAPLRPRGGDA
ncbi:hypothetical protein [Nannocystis pusilla]|uniref:hypothetical protein n=1 Tax=Nannocystis pusilla TaxID=889268 RepID=UPI003B798F68